MPKSKHAIPRQAVLLVTNQEKQSLVDEIIADRPNIGSLFIPDDSFYAQDESISSLARIHKKLCAWLGLNPKHITVTFSQTIESSGYYESGRDQNIITINARHARNNFQIAAILAHCLSHYVLDSSVGTDSLIDEQLEEIVDLVSVQVGLGVVILNGYGYSQGWLYNSKKTFHRLITGQHSGTVLGHFRPYEYAKLFVGNCNDFHTLPEQYIDCLLPGSRKILKKITRITTYPYSRAPKFVISVHKATKRNNLRLVGLVTILIVVGGLIVFREARLPKPLTPEQQALQSKAQLLHRSYDLCQQNVQTKRSVMDTSDLFVQQSIDASANRCESLRNQYNNTVDQYNLSVGK